MSWPPALPLELAALTRHATAEALRRTGGNRTHAARLLGVGLRTLRGWIADARGTEADLDRKAKAD